MRPVTFPVPWQDPRVIATLALLESIYREREIEAIVLAAGLAPAKIAWDPRPDLTWRGVFHRAAAAGAVAALLKAVSEESPTLRDRIDEIWADDSQDDGDDSHDGDSGECAALDALPDRKTGAIPRQLPADTEWVNFSGTGQPEALISGGRSPFLDITFLAEGLRRARSVCRLTTRFPEPGWATGFRIGPETILTAHHALVDKASGRRARWVEASFAVEDDGTGRPGPSFRVRCAPEPSCGEAYWDWAVMRTEQEIPEEFPALPLAVASPPQVDDRVYVVQHPGGGPKKIALAHNLVRFVDTHRVQYWANTDRGSSGAPVFDENWDVVAMHHEAFHGVVGDPAGTRNQGLRTDFLASRIAACADASPTR